MGVCGRVWRKARWIFPPAALLFAALWGVSEWWNVGWQSPNLLRDDSVTLWKGGIEVDWSPIVGDFNLLPLTPGFSISGGGIGDPPKDQCWWPWFASSPYGGGIVVPLWMLFVLTAAPSAVIVRTAMRKRRSRRTGLCTSCGYDRTGIATAAPCPECGHTT